MGNTSTNHRIKDYTEFTTEKQWATPSALEAELVTPILESMKLPRDSINILLKGQNLSRDQEEIFGNWLFSRVRPSSLGAWSQIRARHGTGTSRFYGPLRWPELLLMWDALGRPRGCTVFGTWPGEINLV